MIRELTETLEQYVTTELPALQVEFVRPTDPYNPAQGLDTLNLFLYDVRENVELRNNAPVIRRQGNQVEVIPPPLRVSCSYLVTAWPGGAADVVLREHELLSDALGVFGRSSTIPPQFLMGGLATQEPPLPSVVASGEGPDNPAEFWTAIGNRLKASFTLTVTVGFELSGPQQAPAVITAETSLEGESSFRIAGTVTDAGSNPFDGATVMVVGLGLQATTNEAGEFDLGQAPAGAHTLRVTRGATTHDFNIQLPAQAGANYDLQLP